MLTSFRFLSLSLTVLFGLSGCLFDSESDAPQTTPISSVAASLSSSTTISSGGASLSSSSTVYHLSSVLTIPDVILPIQTDYQVIEYQNLKSVQQGAFIPLYVDSVLVNGVKVDTMYYKGAYVDSVPGGELIVVELPDANFQSILGSAREQLKNCNPTIASQYNSERIDKIIDTLDLFFQSAMVGDTAGLYYINAIDTIAIISQYCVNQDPIMAEAYTILAKEYLYREDLKPFESYASIDDLFAGLSDRYTQYAPVTPNLTQQQTQWLAPISTGIIGITYQSSGNGLDGSDTLVVSDVFPFSPAERAGMQKGDKIIRVNDSLVVATGNNISRFRTFADGQEGTVLVFELLRDHALLTLSVTKENIRVPTVWTDSINGVAIISIDRFSSVTYDPNAQGTYSEFRDALQKTAHFPHTIIDLENNGGGVVSQCTKMADELIKGGLLYKIKYMEEGVLVNEDVPATIDGLGEERSFSFLANKGSASCSEIFLIAVTENRSDKIYGTTTYGKGIGQGIFLIQEGLGGTIKVTSTEFLGPLGTSYHIKGVAPHVEATTGVSALDLALEAYAVENTPIQAQKRSLGAMPETNQKFWEYERYSEPVLINDLRQ
ncbi:MAG: S41 family peptidase [Fibrobacterales bacterium]